MGTKITILPGSGANVYLLEGERGSVLVDTGTAAGRQRTLAACKGKGVGLILLTHGHFDHCQNAAYFAQALGCPVAISQEDAPLLTFGEKRQVKGAGLWGRAFAGASNRHIAKCPIPVAAPQVLAEDGLPLSPYGIDGKIVALPGHTAGSVGVLLDSGDMLVGDAMFGLFRPGPAWCYEDRAQMEGSLQKIKACAPRRIYTGHGLHRPLP